jgi:ABC-2 type transport system permease protein
LTLSARLVPGKALTAGIRGLSQAVIIYILALLLGVKIDWSPLAVAGVLVVVLLGAACFSTFSLIIACLVRRGSVSSACANIGKTAELWHSLS